MTQAIVVADIRSPEGLQRGAIEYRERDGKVVGIAFRCPCGCGEESWLPVNRPDRDSWKWNGDREAPTLIPSIYQSGLRCKWHGFLTKGKFARC